MNDQDRLEKFQNIDPTTQKARIHYLRPSIVKTCFTLIRDQFIDNRDPRNMLLISLQQNLLDRSFLFGPTFSPLNDYLHTQNRVEKVLMEQFKTD
jgi:hypothetical protein